MRDTDVLFALLRAGITGDPVKDDLIEPTWLLKKFCVLNDIDKEMVKRNTYQGRRLEDLNGEKIKEEDKK